MLKNDITEVSPLMDWFVQNGADLNSEYENGKTPAIYAIKENSLPFLKLCFSKNINENLILYDDDGKNLLHHVVSPIPYGSYENVEMLKFIHEKFPALINKADKLDRKPIFYAKLQDSGIMYECLRALGANDDQK